MHLVRLILSCTVLLAPLWVGQCPGESNSGMFCTCFVRMNRGIVWLTLDLDEHTLFFETSDDYEFGQHFILHFNCYFNWEYGRNYGDIGHGLEQLCILCSMSWQVWILLTSFLFMYSILWSNAVPMMKTYHYWEISWPHQKSRRFWDLYHKTCFFRGWGFSTVLLILFNAL